MPLGLEECPNSDESGDDILSGAHLFCQVDIALDDVVAKDKGGKKRGGGGVVARGGGAMRGRGGGGNRGNDLHLYFSHSVLIPMYLCVSN